MKSLFAFLSIICSTIAAQTSHTAKSEIDTLKSGYISRVEIQSPYKTYYFYIYSHQKINKVPFKITSCEDLLLLDTTLKFLYIDDRYPNDVRSFQKVSFEKWGSKIKIFQDEINNHYKRRKYILKELRYQFSSIKKNLIVLKYHHGLDLLFEHYWSDAILPKNVNSEISRFIVLDIVD